MAFHRGHRGVGANLSLATSVDLDVEGGVGSRLEEDYDQGWRLSSTPWSAKGPAAFIPSLTVQDSAKLHVQWAKAGWSDANRWREAFRVAMGAKDIRLGLVKGLALSGTLVAFIFFFELAFFPKQLFGNSRDGTDATVGSIGSVFFLYPFIAGCYFVAASWTMDVAQAANRLRHGRGLSMTGEALPPGTSRRVLQESYRVFLILNYVAISFLLERVPLPFVGRFVSFLFMSFIDAYYCFEQVWIARGWSLERRMRYAESRWSYMVAFGLPSTAVSFFHPSGLLNLMLFLLVFPVCTVLAMLATPQPRVSSTTGAGLTPLSATNTFSSSATSGFGSSANTGVGGTSSLQLSPLLPPRLPIFWPTIKLYRLLLRLFPYSLEADARHHAATRPSIMRPAGSDARWRSAATGTPTSSSPAMGGGGFGGGVMDASGGPNGVAFAGARAPAGAANAMVGGGAYGSGISPSLAGGFGSSEGLAGRRTAAQFVGGAWNQAAPAAAGQATNAYGYPAPAPPSAGYGYAANGTSGAALGPPPRANGALSPATGAATPSVPAGTTPTGASGGLTSGSTLGPPPKGPARSASNTSLRSTASAAGGAPTASTTTAAAAGGATGPQAPPLTSGGGKKQD